MLKKVEKKSIELILLFNIIYSWDEVGKTKLYSNLP